MLPEAAARLKIDELLIAAGWIDLDCKAVNQSAGSCTISSEVPFETCPRDFLLLIELQAIRVIKVRKVGIWLSTASELYDSFVNYVTEKFRTSPAFDATLINHHPNSERIAA